MSMPNVMISDSLEPHAVRLTFAILQPRLDPPALLKCCCKPSTGEPFMGSTITSSPLFGLELVPNRPADFNLGLLSAYFSTSALPFLLTPSLPFPVLPYYHFLGTSYFFQVRFHYGLVVALGLHSSRMERSASPQRWFTLGDPARSDDEKTPNRNSPQAAAFKYGAPRQPPLQDYAAHAHPSF